MKTKELLKKLKMELKWLFRNFKGMRKQKVLVLGDSHAKIFRGLETHFPGYYFDVISVKAASISGLKNPNSVTQAMSIFDFEIRKFRGNLCIINIGEVDTGFLIWYRAQKHVISVDEAFNATVLNYIDFIKKIPSSIKVVCISAPLPTIQDGQDWGEVANLRKEVTATQKERTDLTLKFNNAMESFSVKYNYYYVNLDSESIGNNGCVKTSLLNKNPIDHHYDSQAYLAMLIPALNRVMEEIVAGSGDKCCV